MRYHLAQRSTALVVVLSLLGGCATQTDAEQRFVNESDRELETVGSTAGGAALGGVLAGGLCAVLASAGGGGRESNDQRNARITQSALACGAIGAAVGGMHGYEKAKRKQYLEDQVIALNQIIDDIRQERADLERLNGSADSLLEETRQRLRTIKQDVDSKKATLSELAEAKKRAKDHALTMKKVIDKMEDRKEELAQAAENGHGSPAEQAQAQHEITKLEKEIARLEQTRTELLESASAVSS